MQFIYYVINLCGSNFCVSARAHELSPHKRNQLYTVLNIYHIVVFLLLKLKCDNSQQVIEAEAADEINEITQRRNEYDEYVKNAKKEVERQKQEQDDVGATWGMSELICLRLLD